jgi:Tol biopolymer transport system component/DNA-binding winged helix-turn-helix (wHTH) protein
MFRPGPPSDERALPSRFRFAGFEADLPAARVYRDGTPLPLEPRAFDLLLLLAANPRRVVAKEEIFERLWGKAFVTDNALTRVVAQLRQQLGDRAESPAIIETLRTRGYRFVAAIEPVAEGTVDGSSGLAGVVPATSPTVPGDPTGSTAAPSAAAPAEGELGASRADLAPAAVVGARLRRLGPWFVVPLVLATVAVLAWSRWRAAPGLLVAAAAVQRTVEAGAQLHPDFSPDASHLVFAADVGDGFELFVRPIGGTSAVQVTTDGPNTEPAWSPDGRWIAYRNQRLGGLWLVAPTGQEVRQLTEFGTQPAWSPDSSTIVFSHPGKATIGALEWPATYDSALWVVDVATGASRRLTRQMPEAGGQGMPAFSHDGRWVVFSTANHVTGGGIWRVPTAGGEPVAIVRPAAQEHPGERVLWHDPQPSPDGRAVYAIRLGRDSRIVRLGWEEGASLDPILAPAPVSTVHLALSRDERQMAFAVERAETRIEEVAVDAASNAAAPPRVLVAPSVLRVLIPRYSPDGRHLVVLRRRGGSAMEGVVMDADGREVRVIEASGHFWWASPTEILALAAGGRGLEVDVVSGRQREVASLSWMERALALGSPRGVALSPDQRAVAFTAQHGDGRELMVWEAGAEAPRRLTSSGALVDYPSWSKDGRWIGFQLVPEPQLGNELWRIPAAGGEPERIRSGEGPSWGGSFSPDGSQMVYAAFREGRWYLAIAGTEVEERLLPVPPEARGYLRGPDWAPDGNRIAYERMRYETNLWTVGLTRRRPRRSGAGPRGSRCGRSRRCRAG